MARWKPSDIQYAARFGEIRPRRQDIKSNVVRLRTERRRRVMDPEIAAELNALADQVRAYMKAQHLTATQMGELADVSAGTIYNLLGGVTTSPHFRTVHQLQRVLNRKKLPGSRRAKQ